jgi:hypothetical protein
VALDRAADLAARHAPLAVQGHHGVRVPPHRGRVDDRRVGTDDAVGLEAVDPPLDGRRAQRDLAADVLERAPRVLTQQRNDLAVDVVHRDMVGRSGATDRH